MVGSHTRWGDRGGAILAWAVDGRTLKGGGRLIDLASMDEVLDGTLRIGSAMITFLGERFVGDSREALDMIGDRTDRIDVPLVTPPGLSPNASVPVEECDRTELDRERVALGSELYVSPKSPGSRSNVGFRVG